ncbi:hypothetical protein SERLA73DRAFT_169409 [Serpula lacrymans var. lacrymans S7.3]|uniref:U4/U6 snRNA-associated-splicing factor PRP24 n=2 Tax=Serpula lacrymans var. lacrymans TaxID=341189 RepID=F8PZX8_SERL3|nr:uncharacterized protein SERLADRAFT_450319 [Serpula lacrymans var. lacrymans S7.9]EGN98450.1 hypothetical protein SERLA73DRAFT_169409 [Serpula lacrymans var. lacrymans S7.3]EGO24029.1 hypothetical protein SERLADRAFT_450319 [Serpula lacrymans var. lacrymans S7.9]
MDESASLDSLANLLTELSTHPYDISLHIQHIRLSQSLQGLDSQLITAQEMAANYFAVGDEVWLSLIEAKEKAVDIDSPNGVLEVLGLYDRAEKDYLSIPILQKHVEFIIDRHAHFASLESVPDELGDVCSTEWTRASLTSVVAKGEGHLTKSHLLWDAYKDWEFELLGAAPNSERDVLVNDFEELLLDRLQQPHSNHDETYQAYSSFTTNYKPPQDYESLLVSASKMRSKAVKSYERREASEIALSQAHFSLDAYGYYIASERRMRNVDMFIVTTLYERAIAEAAKRRFSGEIGAEQVLEMFWSGYCDALRIHDSNQQTELDIIQRAVRSVPGCGEVWARYFRYLERTAESEENIANRPTEADIYTQAISTNLFTKDPHQAIPLILARAGFEKRKMESGKGDENIFVELIKILEDGVAMVRQASSTGDPGFRLEKFLAELYLNLADVPENAITVWQNTAKHYKSNYSAWIAYTDVLIKTDRYDLARATFQDICMKNIDWPEAIWEAWLAFEHLYGSVESIEACMDRVERAQYQVNMRRSKEAERAAYQAAQVSMEQQAATVPVIATRNIDTTESFMDVDVPAAESGVKRKAEDDSPSETSKKAKLETSLPPQKRDRENCTVFVAELPAGATEGELKSLFKDCGEVREVKITQLPESLVATVEFAERDSVPGALTKDKKRIQGEEIAVHLAWRSTLYVTNFPEKFDDASVRDLFGQYGVIFDVRWPSKKFKSTRRFCYVQFTSPSSAERALELHGRELEPDRTINVLISNPERKKERTDADANEKEIYVAGLSKFTTSDDLEKLFKTYGVIKEVRMAEDKSGHCKGFAFIEFEQEADAQAALAANNYELKKRRMAVTLADTRVRARNRDALLDTGLGRRADTRNRSVRIRNLPPATQEGLLQQVLEKFAIVKRTEVLLQQNEAVVELENAVEAGKLLLRAEPIFFNGNTLKISEEPQAGTSGPRPVAPSTQQGLFVPRNAASRPRAGLGHARKPVIKDTKRSPAGAENPTSGTGQGKQQDDFRKLLNG